MSTFTGLQAGMRALAATLGSFLLPPSCCMCGFPGARAGLDLCDDCRDMLPFGHPASASGLTAFDCVVAPFRYEYPVDRFVRRLKFQGERLYARVLGTLLADELGGRDAPLPRLLIPIPLHPSRYRARGFNQALEIARFAAQPLGARIETRCLIRALDTREQSGLSSTERRRNVRGAFQVTHPPGARHVALIDDVVTTGCTAAEAAAVLRACGVERIELWATARAVGYTRDVPPRMSSPTG